MLKTSRFFWFTIVLISVSPFSAEAVHPVPAGMKKLNVKCPAPKICRKLERERDVCLLNGEMCNPFVTLFLNLLDEYDCSLNPTDKDKVTVPALWLCESLHTGVTFNALAQVKSLSGQKVYASQRFRDALNGPIAAAHYGASLEREKALHAAGVNY